MDHPFITKFFDYNGEPIDHLDVDLDQDMDDLEDKDLDSIINGAKRERIQELSRSTDSKDSHNLSVVRRNSSIGLNNIARFGDHSKFNFSQGGVSVSPYRTVSQNQTTLPANILNDLGSPMRLADVGAHNKELEKYLMMDWQPKLRHTPLDLTATKQAASQKSYLKFQGDSTANPLPNLRSLLDAFPPKLPSFNLQKPSKKIQFVEDVMTAGDQSMPSNARNSTQNSSGGRFHRLLSRKLSSEEVGNNLDMSVLPMRDEDDQLNVSYGNANPDDPLDRTTGSAAEELRASDDQDYMISVLEAAQEHNASKDSSEDERKDEKTLKERLKKQSQQKYHRAGPDSPNNRKSNPFNKTDFIP